MWTLCFSEVDSKIYEVLKLAFMGLKKDITTIQRWLNGLEINQKNSKSCVFTNMLPRTTVPLKWLGLIIDNQLNFYHHISNICDRVNSKSYLLVKNLSFFPQFRFDYCASIHAMANRTQINRLERCFSKSIKKLLKTSIERLEH